MVPFGARTAQAVDRYLQVRALHPYARSPRMLLGQRGPIAKLQVYKKDTISPQRIGALLRPHWCSPA